MVPCRSRLVTANTTAKKNNWEQASLTHDPPQILPARAAAARTLHGGACALRMQHWTRRAQVAVKRRALEDNLWHLGKVKAETILRPDRRPRLGYATYPSGRAPRHQKGRGAGGFHERGRAATWPTWFAPAAPRR